MKPEILIASATGYVGGQLLQALLAADSGGAGHGVRCLARRPEALRAHAQAGLEVWPGTFWMPLT
jgi:uncharacterized protein YbjT (DUF2867 family)